MSYYSNTPLTYLPNACFTIVIRHDPPFELDEDEDRITKKLLQPMMGLVEDTPDVVQIIMKTHQKMNAKENEFLKRFREKGYECL